MLKFMIYLKKNYKGIYIDDTKDTVGKTAGSLAWVWLEAPNF